ncbi:PH and SEC7 domain-containing protein 4 [Ctenodactylus gundi]
MMSDDKLVGHPRPVELLNLCLGDGQQIHPGVCLKDTCPGPPRDPEGHTWTFHPQGPSKPDVPLGVPAMEPTCLGSCTSQEYPGPTAALSGSPEASYLLGNPRQSQSSSTQVVFWAGILQAQMCVLDLEEELEKTEALRDRLRCCLPTSPPDLPDKTRVHPSPPVKEDCREDSSELGGEKQAWPTPGSSPEWGPEEESVFFDNPLFLESPSSDADVSGEHFSWSFPGSQTDVKTVPDRPFPTHATSWELGPELDLGDSTTDSSGCATPPFPVLPYKSHPVCWVSVAAAEGDPAAPQEEGAAPPSGKTRQTEESPSWPQEPLVSQDRGERDAGRLQEAAVCTLTSHPWGNPASSWEHSSPESGHRGPAPRPTPASSPEGSQGLQRHSAGISPKWPLDASHPSLLETDGAEPRCLTEDPKETPDPGQGVKSKGTARILAAAGTQINILSSSSESLRIPMDSSRIPVSPMPQAQSPEEDQKLLAGDKLANGIRHEGGAWNLASRLYHLEGFRKSEVAAYLQKNNDFSRAVAEEYVSFFQFGGQSLDHALRGFLQALVLSGETQERERILYQFSRRFYHCNPGVFPSVDAVHTLTCAIMLLNTDLHGQNIGKSMSCQQFITNLNGLQDGGNFPKELLKALYWSIRSEKLEWAVEEEAAKSEKVQLSPSAGRMSSPFLQMAQDPTVPTYKQGILARKMHHDAGGKKTPWGKRGWKMFHTLLRGMALYFLKGEDQCLEGETLVGQLVDEPVGIHHSLASPATQYTKKPHVFQLRTADWRLYLFQAPTAKEMTSWIARINLAAATHSAPPFPAAVGSQRRFVRPILPVAPAQSSLEEQHRSHENCLDAASDDLLDLQRNLPERWSRGREQEEYRLRKDYLEYEKTRYETYLKLLVVRLHCPSGDLAQWEEQLEREADGTWESKPSLKKSHSSPSLHQDEAPTTAKVKRNISERRTYRKIIPKRNRNQL